MKPVQYILLVTIFLFVLVFFLTLPGRLRAEEEELSSGSQTSSGVSETSSGVGTTVVGGTSAIVVGGEPGEASSGSSSAASSGSSGNSETSSGGASLEIDNEWAFFLVNPENPLPDNYKITTKTVQGRFVMDERCADFMIQMISDAKTAGVNLNVVSAYRSVEYQQTLLDNDIKQYQADGLSYDDAYAKAIQAVAIPGRSEHNAGIGADLLESGNFTLDENFDQTPEFKWLEENAYKYGFILRYPKNKQSITGIQYEPWHYRFVGLYHAEKIKQSGVTLEEYFEKQSN